MSAAMRSVDDQRAPRAGISRDVSELAAGDYRVETQRQPRPGHQPGAEAKLVPEWARIPPEMDCTPRLHAWTVTPLETLLCRDDFPACAQGIVIEAGEFVGVVESVEADGSVVVFDMRRGGYRNVAQLSVAAVSAAVTPNCRFWVLTEVADSEPEREHLVSGRLSSSLGSCNPGLGTCWNWSADPSYDGDEGNVDWDADFDGFAEWLGLNFSEAMALVDVDEARCDPAQERES